MRGGVKNIFVMSCRLIVLVARFGITLYIAKRIGFEELGKYGVITGVVGVLPTALGFGFINKICRDAVTRERSDIAQSFISYFSSTCILHAILMALALCLTMLGFGAPFLFLVIASLAYSLTEQVSGDVYNLLMATSRPIYASALNALRLSIPMVTFILAAELLPALRSSLSLVALLLTGNVFALASFFATGNFAAWQNVRITTGTLLDNLSELKKSTALYMNDVINAAGQYSDRLVVATLLGTKVTGIYVLFWSIGNALGSLQSTGIIQMRKPDIIRAFSENPKLGNIFVLRLTRDIVISSIALSSIAALFVWVTFPYLGKSEIQPYYPVLYVILAGFTVRMAYEAVGVALYSRLLDAQTLISALTVSALNQILNWTAIPLIGIYGAAIAIVIAYGAGIALRVRILSRTSQAGPVQIEPS